MVPYGCLGLWRPPSAGRQQPRGRRLRQRKAARDSDSGRERSHEKIKLVSSLNQAMGKAFPSRLPHGVQIDDGARGGEKFSVALGDTARQGRGDLRERATRLDIKRSKEMLRKFIIERDVPGIGGKNPIEMGEAAKASNGALAQIEGIQWQHSYVTADKTFCVYLAKSEDLIREHARLSGFPANKITQVTEIIDPTTERQCTLARPRRVAAA
jgi:hypothetical protein